MKRKNKEKGFIIPLMLIIIGLLIIGGGIYYYSSEKGSEQTATSTVSGNEESAYVPPTSTTSVSAAKDSGIKGKVTIGPTCPVATNPPTEGCEDRPYQTTLRLLDQNGVFLKSINVDANGNFRVSISPGIYKVASAENRPRFPSFGDTGPVIVKAHQYTEVNIQFDSGIR